VPESDPGTQVHQAVNPLAALVASTFRYGRPFRYWLSALVFDFGLLARQEKFWT
jgi:hypothetical protein